MTVEKSVLYLVNVIENFLNKKDFKLKYEKNKKSNPVRSAAASESEKERTSDVGSNHESSGSNEAKSEDPAGSESSKQTLSAFEEYEEEAEIDYALLESEPYKVLIMHFNQKTTETFLRCKIFIRHLFSI